MPTPGSLVPIVQTQAPWTREEMATIAAAMGAPRRAEHDRPRGGFVPFVGDGIELHCFVNSRSLRWRAAPGSEPFLDAAAAPFDALSTTKGLDVTPLIDELRLPTHLRVAFSTADASEGSHYEFSVGDGVLPPRAVASVVTLTTSIACLATPIDNARLSYTHAQGRLRAIDLYWNRPAHVGAPIRTLSLLELDALLRRSA